MGKPSAGKVVLAHALTDLSGHFLSVDNRFCELIRRERGEILGRTILDLTSEAFRPLNSGKLDTLRERGTSFVIRKDYLCGDGSAKAVENTVSLLTDGLGGSVVVASVRPLTELPDAQLAADVETARILLGEQIARASLGPAFHDQDWRLLLTAYILEAEGRPAWARDLSDAAGGDAAANLLRVWELVQAGALELDGRPSSLERTSIRVSVSTLKLLERHLAKTPAANSVSY